MQNYRNRKVVVLSTLLLLCFIIGITIFTSMQRVERAVEQSIANQNLGVAKSIAANLDVDTYKKFLVDKRHDYNYWKIYNYLNASRERLGVLYVYTIEIDNPTTSKVMIAGLPQDVSYSIGQPCTVPKEYISRAYNEQLPYVTGVIKDPNYGSYISVGTPIKDANNEVVGYLGIDISAEDVNEIQGTVLQGQIAIIIVNSAFILIIIVLLLFLQRWYLQKIRVEVEDTEDTYQAEIKTLITSVSSLRHDFINHIQVIEGLLMIGEPQKALDYVNSISKEVQVLKSLKLDTKNPGIAILLQTKKITAENYHIQMETTISQDDFSQVKTTDLIKILSNLIDNAIDATTELPEENRKITVQCIAEDSHYHFKIINTGPNIIDSEQIYIKGFTTKNEEAGKIRGQGLFIVKEIVNKYKGTISITSTNDHEITADVNIPTSKK